MTNPVVHGAYYRAQCLSNLNFLFPCLPPLSLITAAGSLYLVTTDPETFEQRLLHKRTYTRHITPSEQALFRLYCRTSVLVREKVRMMEEEDGRVEDLKRYLTTDPGILDVALGNKGWRMGKEEDEGDIDGSGESNENGRHGSGANRDTREESGDGGARGHGHGQEHGHEHENEREREREEHQRHQDYGRATGEGTMPGFVRMPSNGEVITPGYVPIPPHSNNRAREGH